MTEPLHLPVSPDALLLATAILAHGVIVPIRSIKPHPTNTPTRPTHAGSVR